MAIKRCAQEESCFSSRLTIKHTSNISWSNKVMFKKRAGVFFIGFRPEKTLAAMFLNGFENIPGKACDNRAHNNYAFANVEN